MISFSTTVPAIPDTTGQQWTLPDIKEAHNDQKEDENKG